MLPKPAFIDPQLELFLQIGSGIFWTITYLFIIRRSYLDKSYGMPLAALCANVSWEFIFSFVFPHPQPQLYIDYCWLLFDMVILVQYLLYGKKDFPKNLSPRLFYPSFFITLVLAGLIILLMSYEFKEFIGIYAAFGQNLLMSVLFISMFLKRDHVRGQSIYIAILKTIGTILPSYLFFTYYPNSYLLILLYLAVLFYDLVYAILLYTKLRAQNINPWRRL